MTSPQNDNSRRNTALAVIAGLLYFSNAQQAWFDDNGQIPTQRVTDEMFRHAESTNMLEALTKQLYSGQISLQRWEVAVAMEIKDAHLAQSMFAVGGRANMGFVEFGRVGQTLREQYGFLHQFAQDIADGKVSEAQALNRISMYGEASVQSYWAEYAEHSDGLLYYRLNPAEHCEDCIAREAGNPYTKKTLKGYPGDGSTKCKAHDKCTLERG